MTDKAVSVFLISRLEESEREVCVKGFWKVRQKEIKREKEGKRIRERMREGEKKKEKRTRVALAKRLEAGGLEQVITSGCGDAARAGPS